MRERCPLSCPRRPELAGFTLRFNKRYEQLHGKCEKREDSIKLFFKSDEYKKLEKIQNK